MVFFFIVNERQCICRAVVACDDASTRGTAAAACAGMLRSLNDLEHYVVAATDGDVGRVVDFLLDDQTWTIRALVVETSFVTGPRVLVSPGDFRRADWSTQRFHVDLTREKVANSVRDDPDPPDLHLRSATELRGYHIQGTDAEVGHLSDFVIDDETWHVRYFAVATSNWWLGNKVLVAPSWATQVSWRENKIHLSLSRQRIKDSPEWEANAPVNREYEARLYDFYGRPVYWGGGPQPQMPVKVHAG